MKYATKRLAFIFSALITLASCHEKQPVAITHPNVEQQAQPQALATNEPRFSWQYESSENEVLQLDYRIVVASSERLAKKGVGDLWDSGTVPSSRMLLIPYQGKPLDSRDRAYWKVVATVSCGDRSMTVESQVNTFEISLLHPEDWEAQWIGREFNDDVMVGHTRLAARYLRKTFKTQGAVKEARLYVIGLGVYSAFLNGQEVAPEELLKPALSDYDKRVYFNAYDVTSLLKRGENALGVVLEGGRYTAVRYTPGALWGGLSHTMHYGVPRLLLQLEITYRDGRRQCIVSDPSWKMTNKGPIRTANEFDGETYDEHYALGDWTRAGYDDGDWLEAQLMEAPKGVLTPQPNPNIKVQEVLRPVALFQHGDAWYLDMGQNMVGVLGIHLSGQQPGDTLTLRFAELLADDSTLYTANLRGVEATDRYIVASTDPFHWHPSFTYHGFRYVELKGLRATPSLDDFEGRVFYDEMATTGSFETSNEILNAVYRNAYWGIRGNYRSMPTDCPQRDERMGWTGDRTTGVYGESYLFDNHRLYAKWLTDGEDAQRPNGSIPDVFPAYWVRYSDNMTWPGAFVTVADMLYTRFGDDRPIRQHYEAMKRWMVHMRDRYCTDGILTQDTYGDWCMPPESLELIHSRDPQRITGPEAISTPFYCYLAGKMVRFAELMGRPDDVQYFEEAIARSTDAYNARFLDPKTGRYANNTVTANLLPLWFGMVPDSLQDQVFANIVDKTEHECGGHVSTGVIGIQQLMRTLTEHGRGDLALKIAANDTYPSWGYMVRNGATTIWELWNGNTADPAMNSGNHVMLLGDLLLWEYEYLAGIRVDLSVPPACNAQQPTPATRLTLKPYPLDGLDFVNGTYESVLGRIESRWRRDGDRFEWDIVIPANTTAEVWLPTANGYETKTYSSGKHHLSSRL